jgi:hypothetical protein
MPMDVEQIARAMFTANAEARRVDGADRRFVEEFLAYAPEAATVDTASRLLRVHRLE